MNRWTRRALLAVTAWCVLVAPAQAADHFHTTAVPVTASNPVRFSGLTRDAAFSPNGDGVDDTTTTNKAKR